MTNKLDIGTHPSQISIPKVTCELLLELFPFALIINKEMRIAGVGEKLAEAFMAANHASTPDSILGSLLVEHFRVRKPTGIVLDFATVRDVSVLATAPPTPTPSPWDTRGTNSRPVRDLFPLCR